MWTGPLGPTSIKAGGWFIGAGFVGGVSSQPDWRAPFVGRPDNAEFAPFQDSFTNNLGVYGPGATLGYVFSNGTLPSWIGQNARLLFSFGYWHGDKKNNRAAGPADDPQINGAAQNGLIGIAANLGNPSIISRSYENSFHSFEFALRLAGDHPVGGAVVTTSAGLFGGYGRNTYDYTAINRDTGVIDQFFALQQKLNSWRFGGDVGASITWFLLGRDLRLTFGGRAGAYLIRSSLNGEDCYFAGNTNACPAGLALGTFIPGAQFRTTSRDTASNVGFRGTLTGALTYTFGIVTMSVTGFFAYETSVAGVINPSISLTTLLPVNTNVGAPRIGFTNGYSAGGVFMVKIALN